MSWADFNPFDPGLRADPWRQLHALRAAAPILRSNLGFWLLTRHRDCDAVLRDPRFGHRADGGDQWQRQGHELSRDYQGARLLILATMDPPEHTRLRGLLTRVVTARSVAALEPRIRRTVDELTDGLVDVLAVGPVNLMDAVAGPLPLTVMGELLGISVEDRTHFAALSRDFLGGLDHDSTLSSETLDRRRQANADLMKRFGELVAEHRRCPGDDLLGRLSQAGGLTDDELFGLCAFLFMAGLETTRGLIGNAVLALLRHPDQWSKLGESVEEFIRYDTSSPITARTALTDVELDGHAIRRGELVILMLNAANRDPEAFDHPDRLDLTRTDAARHLGFGAGIHYCLGAWLARLETRIVLSRLAQRVPGLELAGEPRYEATGVHRTLADLPVTVTA